MIPLITDNYEAIDGRWWLFRNGEPIKRLNDKESAYVNWGENYLKRLIREENVVSLREQMLIKKASEFQAKQTVEWLLSNGGIMEVMDTNGKYFEAYVLDGNIGIYYG